MKMKHLSNFNDFPLNENIFKDIMKDNPIFGDRSDNNPNKSTMEEKEWRSYRYIIYKINEAKNKGEKRIWLEYVFPLIPITSQDISSSVLDKLKIDGYKVKKGIAGITISW